MSGAGGSGYGSAAMAGSGHEEEDILSLMPGDSMKENVTGVGGSFSPNDDDDGLSTGDY
jgi:hypothetical protein